MKTIDIKNRYGNSIIYSHTCENNTIKITIEKAISKYADLQNANLQNAALQNANLYNANLRNASLRNADLRNANLRNAVLYNADLQNANLYNAKLHNASLRNANMRNANLQNANLYNADLQNADLQNTNLLNANLYNANMPIFCKWGVSVKNNDIQIGCECRSVEEWDIFFNKDCNETLDTNRETETLEFNRIKAVYLAYKIYLETIKE